VVPDERLVDEVWGDSPPPAAAHSLEAYVSRLRRVLAPHEVVIERRSGGYRIDLGRAVLDSRLFAELVGDATEASAAGDLGRAAASAREALDLWAGPVLSGIPLHLGGRTEVESLDERRLRAFEILVDAELAQGRHAEAVGDLRRLVGENPHRERPVAQLMVALYRSDRQAEALEVYERTRRALDDLGLRPSEELQRLAGQIVRHEPQLRAPDRTIPSRRGQRARRRRSRAAALSGVLAVAAIALTLVLTVPTDAPVKSADGPTRVALVRMWDPGGPGSADEAGWRPFTEGLLKAEREHRFESEIIDLFPRRPPRGGYEPGSRRDVARLDARLRSGNFDLVLWPLGLTGPEFFDVVPRNPGTRFVFLDYCCVEDHALGGASNATTITLHGEQAAHLAGYLSGLVEARRPLATGGHHTVSIIVGDEGFPQDQEWEQGFWAGAHRADPDVDVLVDYSHDYDNQDTCERIANRQMDDGSGVVFASAGDCSLGALSAAGIRGVWAVSADEDQSSLGPHILASATKRYDLLVERSVSWYLEGRLPAGEDVELGLVDDVVALVGVSPEVPPEIRGKVEQEAARLRARESGSRPPAS
jgi:basic membrane lipoprotein Med (substrate-binding protein (PBP1-ABC) superfamily)/DNA-binding SARP family transcriptional activator